MNIASISSTILQPFGAGASGTSVQYSFIDPDAGTLIFADDPGLDEVDPDAGTLIIA